ncbi:1-Cys peroxiredoxin [Pyrus ussuriensis x Pyrus communis]|uniref:thioredoxin-dependent peroxiredoxin n=1 Tax=Pyrus ussuriensis x Pyrus communis TaxID=2448454 RepID=A0A5N5HI07_9ROSA|nr:1-Cys peroxiredoxin [Pyrus ussuriensis x Pyrus communis]
MPTMMISSVSMAKAAESELFRVQDFNDFDCSGRWPSTPGSFQKKGVKLVVYHATICLRILSGLRTSKPTTDALNMMESDVNDYSRNQVPSRSLHIVGPDTKVKLSFLYPANTGRNMDEVVRVLESLQKANKHKVATSANWKSGDPMIISPLLSQDEAKKMFPQGYKTMDLTSKKEYLRFTDV